MQENCYEMMETREKRSRWPFATPFWIVFLPFGIWCQRDSPLLRLAPACSPCAALTALPYAPRDPAPP